MKNKKFDDIEIKNLLIKSFKYARGKEIFILIFWDIFVPKKRNKIIKNLKNGMNWKFAFKNASK